MNIQLCRLLQLSLLVLGLVVCMRPPLLANMGDPHVPGEPAGEPSPLLDSIDVLREHLTIDMRPLARREPCRVEATYRLRNNGSSKTLELVFIAGGLRDSVRTFTIALDGRPVFGRFSDSLAVPIEWEPPGSTPGFDGDDTIPYYMDVRTSSTASASRFLFSIDLPEGEHTIHVSYDAEATGYPDGGPIYIWQLGYVLSPARRWASFGGLDAQVLLPEGWEAVTRPGMHRSGDTLIGTWNDLPADAIAISTRKHISELSYWMAANVPFILVCLFTLLLSYRLGWKKGKMLGLGRRSLTGSIPTALLCVVLGFMIFGAGLMAMDFWDANLMGDQQIPGYPRFLFLPFILVGAFVGPVGLLLLIPAATAIIAAAIARSRALQVEPPEPPEPILR